MNAILIVSDDRTGRAVRVVRDREWEQFVCRFYERDYSGRFVRNENADYFTDDKQDAIATAYAMVRS
jgi:hypothetical protein